MLFQIIPHIFVVMEQFYSNILNTFLKDYEWFYGESFTEGHNHVYFVSREDERCILRLTRGGVLEYDGNFFKEFMEKYFNYHITDIRTFIRFITYEFTNKDRVIDTCKLKKRIDYPNHLFF